MNTMNMDRQTGKMVYTIEYCGGDKSGEKFPLCKVYVICNIWSVGVIGPVVWPGVRHCPSVCDQGKGLLRRVGGGRIPREKFPQVDANWINRL